MWLTLLDRRLGDALRRAVARAPAAPSLSRAAARGLAPTFELAVAAMILGGRTRRTGLESLVAGATAASLARSARDLLGRPRPGTRPDGGFPSRHAAAATAIVRATRRERPCLAGALALAALAGLLGRVAAAEHEPADIAAGALVGHVTEWITHRLVA